MRLFEWDFRTMDLLQERVAAKVPQSEIASEFGIEVRAVGLKMEALGLKYPVDRNSLPGPKVDMRRFNHGRMDSPRHAQIGSANGAITRRNKSRPVTMPPPPPPIIVAPAPPAEEPPRMPVRNQAMSPEARHKLADAMRASHARRKAETAKTLAAMQSGMDRAETGPVVTAPAPTVDSHDKIKAARIALQDTLRDVEIELGKIPLFQTWRMLQRAVDDLK